jgi:hypothetical protein
VIRGLSAQKHRLPLNNLNDGITCHIHGYGLSSTADASFEVSAR